MSRQKAQDKKRFCIEISSFWTELAKDRRMEFSLAVLRSKIHHVGHCTLFSVPMQNAFVIDNAYIVVYNYKVLPFRYTSRHFCFVVIPASLSHTPQWRAVSSQKCYKCYQKRFISIKHETLVYARPWYAKECLL